MMHASIADVKWNAPFFEELLNLILSFKTFQKFVRKVLKSMNMKLLNI